MSSDATVRIEANKDLIRRWQDAYNTGNLDVLDELLDPTWASNAWPAGVPQTVAAAKAFGAGMLKLLPDYHCRIEEMIGEGDQVLVRWTAGWTHSAALLGCPPTGRWVEHGGMSLFTIAGGRIVGHWAFAAELVPLIEHGADLNPEYLGAAHHNVQTRALSDAERIGLQRDAVAEHVRAEIAKDWDSVHATFVQDDRARWDAIPMSASLEGIAGVRDFYANFDAALPDFTVTVTAQYDAPGTSVCEATVTGTHKGEYCGVAGSGRTVTVELLSFFEFGDGPDAGKIVTERAYFDNETLLAQMRGDVDAPTGLGLAQRPIRRVARGNPPDAERIRLQRQTVAEHVRGGNAKDWPAVHATIAADHRAFTTALPDWHVVLTGEHHVPGAAIVEATITGTHGGEYCGIPASGRRVSVELAAVFLFGDGPEAGKVVIERGYVDNETILRQMRGDPEAPTGVGLIRRVSAG